MILQRLIKNTAEQNWFVVFIELVESRAMQELLFDLDNANEGALSQTKLYERYVGEAVTVLSKAIPYGAGDELMAIPVGPDILLQSEELKWSIRMILIMNLAQLSELERLQGARTHAQEQLRTYLSSQTF